MAKNNFNKNSIASIFAKKGIFYYYIFFWILLISYLIIK